MDSRQINDEYTEIAHQLIDERKELEHLRYANISIICLSSEHAKKKGDAKVFGQCERVPEKYKWSVPCDFTRTIFEPNIEGFTDEQLKILIFHELLHVGYDCGNLFIRQHDLEDFKLIIDEYGTDWAEVKRYGDDVPEGTKEEEETQEDDIL